MNNMVTQSARMMVAHSCMDKGSVEGLGMSYVDLGMRYADLGMSYVELGMRYVDLGMRHWNEANICW